MIYVDKLQSYVKEQINPLARCYGSQWSHLFTDNEQELHEFASKLGLKRDWFQNKKISRIMILSNQKDNKRSL